MVPLHESPDQFPCSIFLAAAYEILNENVKWKERIDKYLHSLVFEKLVYIPQLLNISNGRNLKVVDVKIVYDMIFAGE